MAPESPISADTAGGAAAADRRARALSMAAIRRALSHGLVMKSLAPR
jgi:hypothetical protein